VGDATEHIFAQDPSILIGKVLRINRDGSIPVDNPFSNSPIFTLGHRNMYGIAFDRNGTGIVTENGDIYYDEVNILHKGGNYGFPTMQPPNKAPELANNTSIKPVRSYWSTPGPTQVIFFEGNKYPILDGKFVFGTYTGKIYALGIHNDTVDSETVVNLGFYPFNPVVALAKSPTGDIYFGGYSLFKLDSLETEGKFQFVFPVIVTGSNNLGIESMSFDKSEKSITLDSTSGKNIPSDIEILIPKKLIENISRVVVEAPLTKTPISTHVTLDRFYSQNSETYNLIKVYIAQPKSNLSVKVS